MERKRERCHKRTMSTSKTGGGCAFGCGNFLEKILGSGSGAVRDSVDARAAITDPARGSSPLPQFDSPAVISESPGGRLAVGDWFAGAALALRLRSSPRR